MKILLLACDEIGAETARFLNNIGDTPIALVLDSGNRNGYNDQIIKLSGVNKNLIINEKELKKHSVIKWLKSLQPDLGISSWWPHIIDRMTIDVPKKRIINFHPSFLPYNRGKDPNFWSLLTGTPFGVTIHYVDEGIDSGDIIAQKLINVTWEDTGQSLYKKSKQNILSLFKKCYEDIKMNGISPIPQDFEKASLHYRKDLDGASRIYLARSYKAKDLLNLIRARTFPPHPSAWFEEDGEKYEVRIEIKKVNKA